MSILVIYAYHENSKQAQENLEFFNRFGLYRQGDVQYCLVINGGLCSVDLSPRWNKKILRENEGHDFGAWEEGYRSYQEEFSYYFFLNNTVIGPFGDRHWIRTFLSLLDQETKMAGIGIDCLDPEEADKWGERDRDDPVHVQSMFWCIDRIGLNVIEERIFDGKIYEDKFELIIRKEIGASSLLLQAGYNISCILPEYRVDYRERRHDFNVDNGHCGDIYHPRAYFGRNVNPFQSIFFKNRFSTETLELAIFLQKEINYY